MFKKCLSLVFIGLLTFAVNPKFTAAQTDANNSVESNRVEKLKADVLKRGTGEKSKVIVKMKDGTKLKGFISQTGQDSFDLTNSKTKQTTAVAYREVAHVKKQGLSTGAKILIGVGVGVAVTAVVLAVAFRNFDPLGGLNCC